MAGGKSLLVRDSNELAEPFLEVCPSEMSGRELREVYDTTYLGGAEVVRYLPLPHQYRFHESKSKYRWLCGGLGSGKSEAVAREACFHSLIRLGHIPHVGLVVSETYRHLADNTLPVFRRAFPAAALRGGSWETAFDRQNVLLHLSLGGIVAFRVTGNKRYEMLRGPQYAWACFDEGRNIPNREPWKVIIARIRYPGIDPEDLRAWGGSTPNGYDWQYDTWVGEYATPDYEWFHAKTRDNRIHLPRGYCDTLAASLDAEDVEQELEANFISRRGAVYRHIKADAWPDGNLYVVDFGFDVRTYTVDLEIDFGYRAPRVHAVVQLPAWSKSVGGHRLDVVVWEWQDARGHAPRDRTIDEMIAAIKAAGFKVRRIYCDPAGDSANDQRHGTNVDLLRAKVCREIHYPQVSWQRAIANGETVVRSLILDGGGVRTLCWAAEPDGTVLAPNSLRAMRQLAFPDHKSDQPLTGIGLKDGINDHDCDAVRYRAVMVHGRKYRVSLLGS